ncbi:hypothetical protein BDW62DRAFT_186567 [Aspergillus aurantiobrunneus]
MRQSHQDEPAPPTRKACVNCRTLKSRCEGAPCTRCLSRQIPCSLSDQPRDSHPVVKSSPPEKVQHFVKLYFELFHPHWPFIHQGSFHQSNESPLLVQSMVVLAMWATNVRSVESAAIDLHRTLDSAIQEQREKWDASIAETASSSCSWPLPMYQAILLHIIFSILSKGRVALGLDLNPSIPANETSLLTSLVHSCRRLGLFYYPNMLARFHPADLVSYVWVAVEEIKRFNLALYRVCNALSVGAGMHDGSMDMDGGWRFPASELQFPRPGSDRLWNAVVREEWDAAVAEGADCIDLDDRLEAEWISRSAESFI